MVVRHYLLAIIALVVVAGSAGCVAAEAHYLQTPEETPTPVEGHRAFPLARNGPAGTFGYTVQQGDTLESVAQQHGTSVDRLRRVNGLGEDAELRPGTVIFIPTPTPTPTATPTPAPMATPTPAPTGPSTVVRHGSRATNRVALTFDMNGREGTTQGIMNWLASNRVPATIFVTGHLVDNTAFGQHAVAVVAANPDLFELGNHSYWHSRMTLQTAERNRSELLSTEHAVARHSNPPLPVRPFFRPPYGDYNQAVLNLAGQIGYTYTVLWDVDPQDWRPGASAAGITHNVVNTARGGSIVLLHLHGPHTQAALPGIVNGLRSRGFELVKLSDLLN